jgi:hypothetical protein
LVEFGVSRWEGLMWRAVLVMLAFVSSLLAADVSGKWEGRIEYGAQSKHPDSGIFLVLKQDGNTLSGSAGPVEDHQFPIKDGKIDGDTIVFTTNPSGTGAGMRFALKVTGSAMEGAMTEPTPAGSGQAARVWLSRVVAKR